PKSDPAHPAIHPTSEPPDISKLRKEEKNLYDLIVRRFLSVFGDPAIREIMTVEFDIAGEVFIAKGSKTLEKNWMEFYGKYAKFDETLLPPLKEGDKFKAVVNSIEKETQPPQRYTQGSIVKELEKHGIGTKTTRAMILQTLYDRNYIQGKSIEVTKLGMVVGETLAKYVPELVSEELTRSFERDMDKVLKGEISRKEVVEKAKKVLIKICKDFKLNEKKIGAKLEKAILQTKEDQSILGECLKCGGRLKILYSPKTKKYFVGCSNYPKCKNIYPLPGGALVQKTGKVCEYCKTPIVKIIRKGKRPFNMCLDPKCKTKESWGKKKAKK
ncbi:MAG: topoisomerase DNA-binding C4 zinc finger domain-containing protein, partial [Candidatus Aenigmarchaeota archaeon]|nr:topoisomerase DNA-binding C4 zinc finger domain-containing protein [Candidatus Aenigmarchaeota archaeon]